MAQLNNDIRQIMVQSRAERQALFEPVSEISRRVQPRHLVEVSTHYAKHKVAGVIGGVTDAIKNNGGMAAAVALGAVAVFDAGRRSAEGSTETANAKRLETPSGEQDAGEVIGPQMERPQQHVTNLSRAKVLAGPAGGLLLGHIIGRAFDPTAKEQELFGKAAGEVHDAASEFINQHSHGAKVAAAQAFGFARYTAAFLAILAAASDYLKQPVEDGGGRSSDA
ncbi:hypothetical protein C8D77_12038 [Mesorhizobium loti]|uniref:Nutrient deprivation-induced protein n=1 Tax=Rhizobium loti TaxID=381 RepID=A0A8E2W6D3_RHILI|nr:hypothetical protein [Mesorhizobium loti]PWJ86940.1 hypothetical protein C8D77_12038 [Mesorhizobium loti]